MCYVTTSVERARRAQDEDDVEPRGAEPRRRARRRLVSKRSRVDRRVDNHPPNDLVRYGRIETYSFHANASPLGERVAARNISAALETKYIANPNAVLALSRVGVNTDNISAACISVSSPASTGVNRIVSPV